MNGETATTNASRRASRTPPQARIGPIDVTGFDGPSRTASASRRAPITSGVAGGGAEDSHAMPRTATAPRCRTHHSWKWRRPSSVRTWVAYGSSAMGSTRTPMPSRSARGSGGLREGQAPAEEFAAEELDRTVAVADPDDLLFAEGPEGLVAREGVVRDPPPGLLVQKPRAEVEDRVHVGREMAAGDPAVLARVHDHGEFGVVEAPTEAPQELRGPRPPRENGDHP